MQVPQISYGKISSQPSSLQQNPRHPALSCWSLRSLPLTFQHNSPASKEDLAEWDPRVGPGGPVLVVQAEHEGLDEGVAIAESVGEDVGDARVYRIVVASVPG